MKEKPLAMLPWFPRDYIAATRHMSLAERGAYTDLLFFEWDTGPLPKEPERLARLLGCSVEEFAEVQPAIIRKFRLTEAGLVNDRIERNRQEALLRRQRAVEKAKIAAAASWASDARRHASSNASSTAASTATSNETPRDRSETMLGAMHEQCPPSPSPSPSPSPTPGEKRGNGGEKPLKTEEVLQIRAETKKPEKRKTPITPNAIAKCIEAGYESAFAIAEHLKADVTEVEAAMRATA